MIILSICFYLFVRDLEERRREQLEKEKGEKGRTDTRMERKEGW
jgi:hypothetical protein